MRCVWPAADALVLVSRSDCPADSSIDPLSSSDSAPDFSFIRKEFGDILFSLYFTVQKDFGYTLCRQFLGRNNTIWITLYFFACAVTYLSTITELHWNNQSNKLIKVLNSSSLKSSQYTEVYSTLYYDLLGISHKDRHYKLTVTGCAQTPKLKTLSGWYKQQYYAAGCTKTSRERS